MSFFGEAYAGGKVFIAICRCISSHSAQAQMHGGIEYIEKTASVLKSGLIPAEEAVIYGNANQARLHWTVKKAYFAVSSLKRKAELSMEEFESEMAKQQSEIMAQIEAQVAEDAAAAQYAQDFESDSMYKCPLDDLDGQSILIGHEHAPELDSESTPRHRLIHFAMSAEEASRMLGGEFEDGVQDPVEQLLSNASTMSLASTVEDGSSVYLDW
ncbi:hypothetical protein B0H15DRAFT_799775 [Mycena belliarum]|uniref:Uncharacterized protein n=1 Tax=Mycena belliarum TaxID=1033014 RepID=A0AAD6U7P0_9AGAR|nr:hypothetical protein B0H15DRAFT_799775 [Mycena belliae]